jgi:lipopolysaccharide transport protein LptA
MKHFSIIYALCACALPLWAAAELSLSGSPLAAPQAKTTILSQTLEMVSSDEENTFYFTKDVRVNSTDLLVTAEKMIVTAQRSSSPTNAAAQGKTQTPLGAIKKIVAMGNVHISQQNREATAGRAEFLTEEGKVVLTENPRVIDAQAIVSGWRITLFHDQRRMLVEQDPNGPARPSVDLAELPEGKTPVAQTKPSSEASVAETLPAGTTLK